MNAKRIQGGPAQDLFRAGSLVIGFALVAMLASLSFSSCTQSPTANTTGRTSSEGATTASAGPTSPASTSTTVHAGRAAGPAQAGTTTVTQQTVDVQAAPVVTHGPRNHKRIALTFDDNYQEPNAFKTLAVLEKYKVPATFFVIGHYVDTGPKLAEAIAQGGFEVGDHTRSHCDCPTLSKHGLRIEIGNGTAHFHTLTGSPTAPLFRPPYGHYDEKTREVAAEKGFKYVVLWDVDTEDWRGRTSAEITEAVLAGAHNGAIVLMHVAAKHTWEALPAIIKGLRARGYDLVTVGQLLGTASS